MSDLKKAFELAASIVSHKSYQSLTQAVIHLFQTLENAQRVAAYEVFGDPTRADDILVRRFPLSLQENFSDENTDLLHAYLTTDLSHGGVQKFEFSGNDFFFLDVDRETPRRVIIIDGDISDQDQEILEGVFGIYANLVSLLDSKERDKLTNLPNRQTFDSTLNDILVFYSGKQIDAESKSSWLALLDIDKFKTINDQYGHLYGDEVLVHFSNLMKKSFRYSDFLFRYGGEEFVVILNNADEQGAEKALEKFRASVEDYEFPFGKVTVSIGYTPIDPKFDISVIVENADKAVYQAKSNGRNQVIHSNAVISEKTQAHDDIELF
jgi:diguanylate cyclase (GGDEF)-like protein